jgi:hypothetical protein
MALTEKQMERFASLGSLVDNGKDLTPSEMEEAELLEKHANEAQPTAPTKSGLLGGDNAQISAITPMGEVKRFVGENVIEPLNQFATSFAKAGTLGLAPISQTEPNQDISGGQPSPTSIVQKGAEAVGEIGGNLIAGEGIGKVIGGSFGLAKNIIKKLPAVKAIASLHDYKPLTITLSREVKQIPRTLQSEFGSVLKTAQEANPTAVSSVVKPLEGLNELGTIDPKIQTALGRLAKNKEVAKYIKNPKTAASLSVSEAQKLTNTIMKELPEGYTATKIKHGFDNAISEVFPEMAEARAKYGAGMGDYELLHNLENTANNINKIKQRLGSLNVQDAAKRQLSEELKKEIYDYAKWYDRLNFKVPFKAPATFGKESQTLTDVIEKKNTLKPESKMLQFLKSTSGFTSPMKGVVAGGINGIATGSTSIRGK